MESSPPVLVPMSWSRETRLTDTGAACDAVAAADAHGTVAAEAVAAGAPKSQGAILFLSYAHQGIEDRGVLLNIQSISLHVAFAIGRWIVPANLEVKFHQ